MNLLLFRQVHKLSLLLQHQVFGLTLDGQARRLASVSFLWFPKKQRWNVAQDIVDSTEDRVIYESQTDADVAELFFRGDLAKNIQGETFTAEECNQLRAFFARNHE